MITNASIHSGGGSAPDYRPETLIDLLTWRAHREPHRTAYTFLEDGEEVNITYGELDSRARAIGCRIQSLGITGERALLLYPSGIEFIVAFFGCLYGGVVAVPAYPPDQARLSRTLSRLQAIANDAQPQVALTVLSFLPLLEGMSARETGLGPMRVVATDAIDHALAEGWHKPDVDDETKAFLQYTSGSTAAPKGVMISHSNLLHNELMIQRACGHTQDSTFVGWLPLYHDMGLIGNVIQPLFIGARCVLLSPAAFLQKPFRWLQAISRYKAATSGGPNFSYDLCVRKVTDQERSTLDLSSWTTAFNGAEPVRQGTLERFASAFRPCGFRPESFFPCYGLAEATLIVSGRVKEGLPACRDVDGVALERDQVIAASPDSGLKRSLVGCGQALLDQNIIIVDARSLTPCQEDCVGEIWVSGRSVAKGYWRRPEESEQTFNAFLAGTGQGPFLRTGDLGFIKDGELFITGRLKDLIIIRGRNIYPQDIELAAERSHPALRPGCGAAFSVEGAGEEHLVIAQEINSYHQDFGAVVDNIRQAVAEENEIWAHTVVLLKPGTIPKTSSGKIQRQECRNRFLHRTLEVVAVAEGSQESEEEFPVNLSQTSLGNVENIQAWLVSQLAVKLRMSPSLIDVQRSLTQYGLDSLMVTELVHNCETDLGIIISITNLLESPSISHLAKQMLTQPRATPSAPGYVFAQARPALNEFALSRGQQGLWFLQRLAPGSPAYNIARAMRIRGDLDSSALRRTFQALVDRHPSLRATFAASAEGPLQRVQSSQPIRFSQEDASELSEAFLNERLVAEANCAFDLEKGPLLRIHLFKRSAQEHILLLGVHHIIADLWSLAVLLHEMGIIYQAERSGSSAALPHMKLQYSDYVQWQSEMLAAAAGERLWSYWQKQLAGELPVLNLPADRPRPPAQTYSGGSCALNLGTGLTSELKKLAQSRHATLYMTLLAAFEVLLYRYTDQEDFLVGSPTSGRNRTELAGLVGYFVNPVVLRARIVRGATFDALLAGVRQTVLDAFDHQEYPFAQLVERLQPARDPRRSPLFQAAFVLQKAYLLEEQGTVSFALDEQGARLNLSGLSVEAVPLKRRFAQFDLTLTMAEVAGQLSASFEYNSDLFDAATINRMGDHFRNLLEAITKCPEQRLEDLRFLTDGERHQLLEEWNNGGRDFARSHCIHELFEARAERRPHAIAAIYEEETLSYAELNVRANQLAHYLRKMGVGPDSVVALCVERKLEMLIGLLGILKAGGAYLPLDPAYPAERLAFMLNDSNATVLLTESRIRGGFEDHGLGVVLLDSDREAIARQSKDTPACTATSDNLAYIIYTSGSTGMPKGVMVSHANVTRLLKATEPRFDFNEDDTWALFHSYAFDFSVWEIWGALLYGGRAVVVPYWVSRSPQSFYNLLRRHRVTILNQTPSAFRQLIQADEDLKAADLCLRQVIFGGEALELQSLSPWLDRHGDEHPRLINMYGITETTVHVTYRQISRNDVDKSFGSPIGGPIPDLQVYVLDRRLQPVPITVAGEMYVGGSGLARGYLNRPDLSAERFIPDPFAKRPGSRLYKSGDLARFLDNGDLQYLGRRDQQVKIRGFRIELNEIEAALSQHPAVREALVLAREDIMGDKRLVCYVVFKNHPASTNELRTHLREKLPDYMIPSHFVVLEGLPLTPSGKLDRRALPAPEATRAETDQGFIAPRNELEETLAGIFGETLGLQGVGVNDNFFELGGHSLLATQVVSRVHDGFQVEVPLRSFFETPTVASLAETMLKVSGQRLKIMETARLLLSLARLSDDEVDALLDEEGLTSKEDQSQ